MKSLLKPSDFNPSEDAEQEAVMEWAAWSPHRKALKWLHHTPNGGHRSGAEAAKFKRLGVKAGVSDLFLPHPVRPFHGLWIEMKRRHGGVLSDKQAEFLRDMANEGYATAVAKGADEAREIIEKYLERETKNDDRDTGAPVEGTEDVV